MSNSPRFLSVTLRRERSEPRRATAPWLLGRLLRGPLRGHLRMTVRGQAKKEERKRNAGRRTLQCPPAYGVRGAPRKGGLRRPSAIGRARLPAFHHGTCGSDRTPPLSSSSRASRDGAIEERVLSAPCRPGAARSYPRGPVIVPAGRFGPEPPESGLQIRPREPYSPHLPACLRQASFRGRECRLKRFAARRVNCPVRRRRQCAETPMDRAFLE